MSAVRSTLLLYISGARALRRERDVVARAVAEIPTSLGWSIKQTPPAGREPDLAAITRADAHILLLGQDIEAPVGLEWSAARRADRPVRCFAHDATHTQAAHGFIRDVAKSYAAPTAQVWPRFKDIHDLRLLTLRFLADHLIARAIRYDMASTELESLRKWRAGIGDTKIDDVRATADAGATILTTERYTPSSGALLSARR